MYCAGVLLLSRDDPAHQESWCGLLHLADESGKRLHLETGSHDNQEVTLCEVPLVEGLEPLWKLLPKEHHAGFHHCPTGDTCRDIIRKNGCLHLWVGGASLYQP